MAAARPSSLHPRRSSTALPRRSTSRTSFPIGRSSTTVSCRLANASLSARNLPIRFWKVASIATALSPCKLLVEVLGDRAGAGEPRIDGDACGADEKPRGNDPGLEPGGGAAGRRLYH